MGHDEAEGEVTADHRPDTYEEDGRRVWRASSFGSCESSLVRLALGQTPEPWPENILARMNESADLETEILGRLPHETGYRTMHEMEMRSEWGRWDDATQQLVAELPVPGGIVRCHPDGVVRKFRSELDDDNMGECRVVEVKALQGGGSMNSNASYPWQFSIEMLATGLPGMYVVANKDKEGQIVGDLDVTYHDTPPHSLGKIKARIARLNRLIAEAETNGGVPPCDVKQFPCGFYREHDTETGIWAKDAPTVVEGLDELLDAWAGIRLKLAGYGDEEKKVKAAILALLDERELKDGKYIGAGGALTDKPPSVVRIIEPTWKTDKAAAKADGVDLDKYRVQGSGKDYLKWGN